MLTTLNIGTDLEELRRLIEFGLYVIDSQTLSAESKKAVMAVVKDIIERDCLVWDSKQLAAVHEYADARESDNS